MQKAEMQSGLVSFTVEIFLVLYLMYCFSNAGVSFCFICFYVILNYYIFWSYGLG